MPGKSGILYVIGTPIGNLGDISDRAKQILKEVDLILAEDTRQSRILLDHIGISKPMQSYHDFNERKSLPGLLDMLRLGKKLALISDAGTPLICDPGYPLVKMAHEQGIRLVPVPGPSALSTALSVSGIDTDKFIFEGFLPETRASRRKRLQTLTDETRTLVIYEAPHRILGFLEDVRDLFGNGRLLCVCRELTKRFETIHRGEAGRIYDLIKNDPVQQKGEFVVIIKGNDDVVSKDNAELSRITSILLKHGLSIKSTSFIAAEITGAGKNSVYKLAMQLAKNSGNQS